ncbi:MAG TPA: response regulator [Acidobacteriaceae bacterium]|nr:response regulator [Acidobacteriaceae bacterium]
MKHKILCVDDEASALEGYQRILHRLFEVSTAISGAQGLAILERRGPYAVVISDMRMPGMNGAEFLSRVREKAPETVRMLLTGYSDMNAAVEAVNRGRIFQFLTKPCERDVLVAAIASGVEQYANRRAEKDLLKSAEAAGRARSEWDAAGANEWEKFESPAGLPGPVEAKACLDPRMGADEQGYAALLKLHVLHTVEERYGETAAGDYLTVVAQLLMKALRPDDQLFHWSRDVLMAVLRRHISAAAVRMELERLTAEAREYIIDVKGRRMMIACLITFDVLPVAQFPRLTEMLMAFDAGMVGGLRREHPDDREKAHG